MLYVLSWSSLAEIVCVLGQTDSRTEWQKIKNTKVQVLQTGAVPVVRRCCTCCTQVLYLLYAGAVPVTDSITGNQLRSFWCRARSTPNTGAVVKHLSNNSYFYLSSDGELHFSTVLRKNKVTKTEVPLQIACWTIVEVSFLDTPLL